MTKRTGLVSALLAASLASGASNGADKPDVQAKLLVPESLATGSKTAVAVEMTIGSGWHG